MWKKGFNLACVLLFVFLQRSMRVVSLCNRLSRSMQLRRIQSSDTIGSCSEEVSRVVQRSRVRMAQVAKTALNFFHCKNLYSKSSGNQTIKTEDLPSKQLPANFGRFSVCIFEWPLTLEIVDGSMYTYDIIAQKDVQPLLLNHQILQGCCISDR